MENFIDILIETLYNKDVIFSGTYPLYNERFFNGNEIIIYASNVNQVIKQIENIPKVNSLNNDIKIIKYDNYIQAINMTDDKYLIIRVIQLNANKFRQQATKQEYMTDNYQSFEIYGITQTDLANIISDYYIQNGLDRLLSYEENSLWISALDHNMIQFEDKRHIKDFIRASLQSDYNTSRPDFDRQSFISKVLSFLNDRVDKPFIVGGSSLYKINDSCFGSEIDIYLASSEERNALSRFISDIIGDKIEILLNNSIKYILHFMESDTYLTMQVMTGIPSQKAVVCKEEMFNFTIRRIHQSYYIYKILSNLITLQSTVTVEECVALLNYTNDFNEFDDTLYEYELPDVKEDISTLCKRITLQVENYCSGEIESNIEYLLTNLYKDVANVESYTIQTAVNLIIETLNEDEVCYGGTYPLCEDSFYEGNILTVCSHNNNGHSKKLQSVLKKKKFDIKVLQNIISVYTKGDNKVLIVDFNGNYLNLSDDYYGIINNGETLYKVIYQDVWMDLLINRIIRSGGASPIIIQEKSMLAYAICNNIINMNNYEGCNNINKVYQIIADAINNSNTSINSVSEPCSQEKINFVNVLLDYIYDNYADKVVLSGTFLPIDGYTCYGNEFVINIADNSVLEDIKQTILDYISQDENIFSTEAYNSIYIEFMGQNDYIKISINYATVGDNDIIINEELAFTSIYTEIDEIIDEIVDGALHISRDRIMFLCNYAKNFNPKDKQYHQRPFSTLIDGAFEGCIYTYYMCDTDIKAFDMAINLYKILLN